MTKYLLAIVLGSNLAHSASICDYETFKYRDDIPVDFRWEESEFNAESAQRSLDYFSKIVSGDLSDYHWISSSHAHRILEGYTYKLLAQSEIEVTGEKTGPEATLFCNWLSRTLKAD
ncbi:hypothetical protein ACRBDM_14965 [Vibrio parahaemolyticus]